MKVDLAGNWIRNLFDSNNRDGHFKRHYKKIAMTPLRVKFYLQQLSDQPGLEACQKLRLLLRQKINWSEL